MPDTSRELFTLLARNSSSSTILSVFARFLLVVAEIWIFLGFSFSMAVSLNSAHSWIGMIISLGVLAVHYYYYYY